MSSGVVVSDIRAFAEYVMERGKRRFSPMAYFDLSRAQKEWLGRKMYALYDDRMRRIDQDKAVKQPFSAARLFDTHRVPDRPAPADLVMMVHGLRQVEVFIPDYAALILEIVREEYARALFATTWAGEESNHNLWLKWWLQYRGAATQDECYEHDARNLSHRWDPRKLNPNMADPLYVLAYTARQEKDTAIFYELLANLAKEADEWALADLCIQLKGEEMNHHAFYLKGCKLVRELAPEQFDAMVVLMHDQFDMPLSYVEALDGYQLWTSRAQNLGLTPDFFWAVKQWLRSASGTLRELVDARAVAEWKTRARAWDRYVDGAGGMLKNLGISSLPLDVRPERQVRDLGKLILPSGMALSGSTS